MHDVHACNHMMISILQTGFATSKAEQQLINCYVVLCSAHKFLRSESLLNAAKCAVRCAHKESDRSPLFKFYPVIQLLGNIIAVLTNICSNVKPHAHVAGIIL